MPRVLNLFSSCAVLWVVACGATPASSPAPSNAVERSDRGHGSRADLPACVALAKACHAHDKDSEQAHACHVLGHTASTNEACEAKRAECLAICGSVKGPTP